MSARLAWIIGFALAFLTCIAVVSFRLGWLQAFSYKRYQTEKVNETYKAELIGKSIPDFPVLTKERDSLSISQFMPQSINLLLLLGPGCMSCSRKTVELISNYTKTKKSESEIGVLALVSTGQHEFEHLRLLAECQFSGKIAKFEFLSGINVQKFPAIYIIDKTTLSIQDIYLPNPKDEKGLRHFLSEIMPERFPRNSSNRTVRNSPNTTRKISYPTKNMNIVNEASNTKLILHDRIQLEDRTESNVSLVSNVLFFTMSRSGRFYFNCPDRYITRILVFEKNGKFKKSIMNEDIFGPGHDSDFCLRIIPLNERKVCFLYMNYENKLAIYDEEMDNFEFVSLEPVQKTINLMPGLRKKDFVGLNAVVDVACSANYPQLYLFIHPQQKYGQQGKAQIVLLNNKEITNKFNALPDLRYINSSEIIGQQLDQIVVHKDRIYVSGPLDDRIYQFNLNGNRLDDSVYPAGVLESYGDDISALGQNTMQKWRSQNKIFSKIDIIRDIFPIQNYDGKVQLVVLRQKGNSRFLDLFTDDDKFFQLGECKKMFEKGWIASNGQYIYGYRWPELKGDEFQAVGNPEIVVYELIWINKNR